MIDLKEAIAILESGNWCAIDYISYDKKQRRYGHIVRLPRCRITYKASDTHREGAATEHQALRPNAKRQSHSFHATRNMVTPSGAIRKVHLRLIFQINGKRVL